MIEKAKSIDNIFARKARENKDTWKINGTLLGYPDCCIKSFCVQLPSERTENQRSASIGGFIPCIEHAKQIVSGKIKAKDIIKNRLSSFKLFSNE